MNNWRHILVLSAGWVGFCAYPPYIYGMLYQKVRPSRSSWWCVTLIMSSMAAGSWIDGATEAAVLPSVFAICNIIISLFACYYGEGGWRRLDRWCVATVSLSIALAVSVQQPVVAVVGSAIAHLAANVPTVVKTYHDPPSESKVTWLLLEISALLNLAAIDSWSVTHWAHPISGLVVCTTIMILTWRQLGD